MLWREQSLLFLLTDRAGDMNFIRLSGALIAIAALMVACSQPFVFRNDDRPTFENTISANELVAMRDNGAAVIDVRLTEDFADDPQLIPDAMYRDPEAIESWAAAMSPKDQPVIVYCVRGKWVSQKAANYLKDQGYDVYSLEGGIEGWKQAGMATMLTAQAPD
jgi:rhodanese-related sulfurtransferase